MLCAVIIGPSLMSVMWLWLYTKVEPISYAPYCSPPIILFILIMSKIHEIYVHSIIQHV